MGCLSTPKNCWFHRPQAVAPRAPAAPCPASTAAAASPWPPWPWPWCRGTGSVAGRGTRKSTWRGPGGRPQGLGNQNGLLVGGIPTPRLWYPSGKYESQLGWLFQIYGKHKNCSIWKKNVPNHQPEWFAGEKSVSFIGNMWEKMWSDGILCGFDGDSDSIWL